MPLFAYERVIKHTSKIIVVVETDNIDNARETAEEYLSDDLSTKYVGTIHDVFEDEGDVTVDNSIKEIQ